MRAPYHSKVCLQNMKTLCDVAVAIVSVLNENAEGKLFLSAVLPLPHILAFPIRSQCA